MQHWISFIHSFVKNQALNQNIHTRFKHVCKYIHGGLSLGNKSINYKNLRESYARERCQNDRHTFRLDLLMISRRFSPKFMESFKLLILTS
jgi:hypothetical protein